MADEKQLPQRLQSRPRVMPRGDLQVCGVTVREKRNRHGTYYAEDVVRTGLPMWEKSTVGFDSGGRVTGYKDRVNLELVKRYRGMGYNERACMGVPVEPGEPVVGWLKVYNGYVPLYKERSKGERHEKVQHEKVQTDPAPDV